MRSAFWVPVLGFITAVIVIGCGGGGAGGGGGSGGPGGGTGGQAPLPGQYLEFVSTTRSGSVLDPLNLLVGDDVQVVVANYDPGGNRTVLGGTNWGCTADPNDVQFNSLSGRLHVLRRPAGMFSVSASANVAGQNKSFRQDCNVPSGTTSISGRVMDEDSSAGVKYVQVSFYDQSGAALGGALTGDDGFFKGFVPSSVRAVSIKSETVPAPPFYRSFLFNGKVYTMDASTCPLKLGTVKAGQDNPMGGSFFLFLQVNGPPPPPDGCTP
ncbi:MAG: hypothetical protein JSS66_10485 [Armatimonadetes bacterium]|nr:hypothetical protein [Armatimonadota bacterium]